MSRATGAVGAVSPPVGPYDGRGSHLVGALPQRLRGPVAEAGGMVQLLIAIIVSVVKQPTGFWGAWLEKLSAPFKKPWVPFLAAILAFLFSMWILTSKFFDLDPEDTPP